MSTKFISFELKGNVFTVGFSQFSIEVLHHLCRILDIEDYRQPLIIEVNQDIYREVGEFLSNNHWCLNFADHINSDAYNIVIDGVELTIKMKPE